MRQREAASGERQAASGLWGVYNRGMGLGRDMAYAVGAAVTSPLWGWRMLRTGKWRTDWPGRFGYVNAGSDGEAKSAKPQAAGQSGGTVLIHAVSVGEVNATRLLVQRLHERSGGQVRIVVSATTDTGVARARQLFEPAHRVVRYPLDFTRSVRRFLDAVGPNVVALVELEVWPTFVHECVARGAAVCVINGRLSGRSYRRYRLIAPLLRSTFASLAAAAVQTAEYGDHFRGLGVPAGHVCVTDTMKWDTAVVSDEANTGVDDVEGDVVGGVDGAGALAAAMGIDRARPIVVAGSTGPGEERMLIDVSANWPGGAQLVLVPRKPERFEEVARLAPDMVRRSRCGSEADAPSGRRLFLLDTMGELMKAYALADVAIVGRSFANLHGSNPLEPVSLGRATIIGPQHSDFADVVTALADAGGIEVTADPGSAVARLLVDRQRAAALGSRGRQVIRTRQGATDRHVDLILDLLAKSNCNRSV